MPIVTLNLTKPATQKFFEILMYVISLFILIRLLKYPYFSNNVRLILAKKVYYDGVEVGLDSSFIPISNWPNSHIG